MRNYVNAAPNAYTLNTSDQSGRSLDDQVDPLAQFIPKIYTFAARGDENEHLVDRVGANHIFGLDTFDVRSPYATHATIWLRDHLRAGGVAMVQRVIPEDAKPVKSNLTLWMEVRPTNVPDYQRNSIGHYIYDAVGNPVANGMVAGHEVKFVVTSATTETDFNQIGVRAPVAGDLGAGSMRYPIMDIVRRDYGADGDNIGFRISAYGGTRDDVATESMKKERAYPIQMGFIQKTDPLRSPLPYYNLSGDLIFQYTVKPDAIDPLSGESIYLADAYDRNYVDLDAVNRPREYGLFDTIALYDDNIETILGMLHAAEVPFLNTYHDFTADAEDIYLVNFLSGTNVNGAPYHSVRFVDDATSVRLTNTTDIFLRGGNNGTMDNQTFDDLVFDQLIRYGDVNDPLMDMAVHVESTFVDTGFSLATKLVVPSFISQRPDTNFLLSTHVFDTAPLSLAEEMSVAGVLHARIALNPESDFFGTPAMRGSIVGGSLRVRDRNWRHRVPLTVDYALKVTTSMGLPTGRWDSTTLLDRYPNNKVTYGYDISIPYLPLTARFRLWDVGLIWAIPDSRQDYLYPHHKTVYSDDTSVLTSFLTMFCVCDLNKAAYRAWRHTSGDSGLSDNELLEQVNKIISDHTAFRYASRFTIIPDAFYTTRDKLRGYSWTLPIKLYANNMKTVQTSYIQVYRASDLEQ